LSQNALMSADPYKGYRDPVRQLMQRFGITVWSEVEVESTRGDFRGLVLPRSETSDAEHLVLKLGSGYNVGLRADTIVRITKLGYREAHYKVPEKEFPSDPHKPRVRLFGTGGTIASRLDYRTGAVIPAFTPGELYGSVPELADICNLETHKLFSEFSENMGPQQYLVLASGTATTGSSSDTEPTRCTTRRRHSPSWCSGRPSRSSWWEANARPIGRRRMRRSI